MKKILILSLAILAVTAFASETFAQTLDVKITKSSWRSRPSENTLYLTGKNAKEYIIKCDHTGDESTLSSHDDEYFFSTPQECSDAILELKSRHFSYNQIQFQIEVDAANSRIVEI